jgi:hypothetical protein
MNLIPETPDEALRPVGDPAPVPPDWVAWEEEVAAMTEDEFYKYLEEQEGGLTFGV